MMILNAIARDLAGWPLTGINNGYYLQLNDQLQIEIKLHSKRLFMASVHSCRFSCSGMHSSSEAYHIQIHQPGWLRRQAVEFRSRKMAGKAIAAHLNRFANLRQTLSELHYRRIELSFDTKGWHCTIEPWAASEVICRMPPLRRYLRLEKQQRMLLLSSLNMINEVLNLWSKNNPI
ncbi:DUF3156 family protein [Erwinia sp. S63]|uniref:DUF3156 family protein n=1 Tax=Erwinia sp. S63 TaxID=2769341 RepID=UPI00190A5E1D|nr:DUF3156 family protein [Erwinia sp. S63]MBK0097437.1 DUF3156 family protein [Erwinia sp. S63]